MAQLDLFPPGKNEPQILEESFNANIEGLSNFSFSDIPQDEVELRVHFNKFIEQMQINDALLQKRQQQQFEVCDSLNITHSIAAEHNEESRSGCNANGLGKNTLEKQNRFFGAGYQIAEEEDDRFIEDTKAEELRQFEMIEQQIQNETIIDEFAENQGGKTQRGNIPSQIAMSRDFIMIQK